MMSKENKLTDEQLTTVSGGEGYEQDGEWVINGQNVNVTKTELIALAAKDPIMLTSYEKVILDYAKKVKLI